MFRPARLITLAILAMLVYAAFFATPAGDRVEGSFDADEVAAQEVSAWKADKAHQDFGVYFSLVAMLREQYRYSWFRAAEAGFYLARVTTTFAELHSRYERVLPDIEEAAAIEKAWMKASFDPAAVARAQLNWMVTRNMPNLNSLDSISELIAEEYSLRYHIGVDRVMDAAILRAEAMQQRDEAVVDPDWPAISKRLADSYRALSAALEQDRRRRH